MLNLYCGCTLFIMGVEENQICNVTMPLGVIVIDQVCHFKTSYLFIYQFPIEVMHSITFDVPHYFILAKRVVTFLPKYNKYE